MAFCVKRFALLASLMFAAALCAQSYRGVQVGQRDDFLPPEFSQTKRGEFNAQFSGERVQVFVNGALVTGFRVLPQIPLTLAEAVAKHGSIPNIDKMFVLLDPDGDPQGLVDPIKRISYVTRELGPDGIVNSIGYYDDNTALLIWTDDADPVLLQALADAAKNASLQDLNARPRLASLAEKAQFMMEQALKVTRDDLQTLTALLSRYQQSCSGGVTSECQEAKRTQLQPLAQTAERFRFELKRADDIYATNAELFHNAMPSELARLHQSADRLLPQVPLVPQGLQPQ